MEKISWASKIQQTKVWRLYQNDARGTLDEVQVEDVGLALLQHCQSIRLVTTQNAWVKQMCANRSGQN